MGKKEIGSPCFFEDEQSRQFKPLTLTRPVDDLRTGIYTIREKWMRELKADSFQRAGRSDLDKLFPSERKAGPVTWVNSRLLPEPSILKQVRSLEHANCICSDEVPLAIKTDAETTTAWLRDGIDMSTLKLQKPSNKPILLERVWNLLDVNAAEIERDIGRTRGLRVYEPDSGGKNNMGPGVFIYGEQSVYTDGDVIIEPGTVLVTTGGPIYLGSGAHIMAGSVLRGPVAICSGSTIKSGSKIYENSTVGPVCKVGGEISSTIFHSYSNKGHDGYTGNSIFGQWCNLGADTNTSNLKNNYSTVKFTNWQSAEKKDTGVQFLGTIMGDHSKTGINSMLNTGTSCGVSSNLFGEGYLPEYIPSFSWVNAGGMKVYIFEKAVETMERTMARRQVELTDEYVELMRNIFNERAAGFGEE